MDDITAPEGISDVEKEVSSPATVPEQREEGISTKHDDKEAQNIEAAFDTRERTRELKQEAHEEGEELARRSQGDAQPPPPIPIQEVSKPDQEIPKPSTQDGQQPEHSQSQPQMHPLTRSALTLSQQRAILRERLRAENGEVKKAA